MKLRNVHSTANMPGEPGDFCIDIYADGTGTLRMMCPSGKRMCDVGIKLGEPDQEKRKHGWNGDSDAPTIMPSIGCDKPGRCGWHGSITNGERAP